MEDKNEVSRILAVYESSEWQERARSIAKFGYAVNDNGIGIVAVQDSLADDQYYLCSSSYTSLRASIEELINDDKVKKIAILINSPGGDVNGLFECCDFIHESNNKKPIVAHVTGMCCSAAYAIASACSNIMATETSEIGSIGVIASARSYEKYDERRGILSKIFRSKNADKKVLSPFTEEGGKSLQEKLDYYESKFYDLVSASRGIDKQDCIDSFGHGATYLGLEAASLGMIDGIATYSEFMEQLASSPKEEEEEENMDISKMGAEERKELFNALVEAEPSLAEELKGNATAKERERITSLLSNRTESTASIIDAAIAEGKEEGDIAMELFHMEKARADELAKVANPMEQIEQRAEAQQGIDPVMPNASMITDTEAHMSAERVAKYRKERLNG